MRKLIIYLFGFMFLAVSCNENVESGGADDAFKSECIGLSINNVRFSGCQDTILIKTEGLNWWFAAIEVDGIDYKITPESKDTEIKTHAFSRTCDWLTIQREAKKVTLIATWNSTFNKERIFKIHVQSKDSIDTIEGIQGLLMDGPCGDEIGLSTKTVNYTSDGGSITIDTKEHGWWIYSTEVDGIETYLELEDRSQIAKGEEFVKTYDWLTVKTSYKKIELMVETNTEDMERIFKIGLESGDYFDFIEGKQDASK